MQWRKYQVSFSWKPIVYCTLLNLAAAGIVFLASFLLTGNVFLTILYTMYAWLVTVTASFGYWICWFFRRIKKVPGKIEVGFVALMIILLAIDWLIIWSCLGFLV